jgi:CheY-like chemotaxis protein
MSCKSSINWQEEYQHKLRILIVEDNLDNQLLLSKFLSPLGAQIDTAVNGLIGWEKATHQSFDLIIMDIQLPELDGIETTVRIRKLGITTPILAHSAYSNPESVKEYKKAGCDLFLPKPTNRKNLYEAIEKLLMNESVKKPTLLEQEAERSPPAKSSSKTPASNPFDRSLYKDDPVIAPLLPNIITKLPLKIQALKLAIDNNNQNEATFLAHQLKGTLLGFGFVSEGKAAGEIEEYMRRNPPQVQSSVIYRHMSDLMTAFLPDHHLN